MYFGVKYYMKRKTHDEFVNDVKSKYGNEYTVIGHYVNNKEYIKLRHNCDKCNNHIFDMRPNDFLYGHKCPFCFPKSVLKTDDMFRKQVIDLYNDEYTVMGKYLCNSEKILMRHNNESCNNYEWLVLPRDFLGGKSKCPECSKLIRSAKTKKSIESVQAKFNEYYGDNEYTVLEYINYNTPIKVLHNECNTQFTIHSNNAYKKNGCPCKHCKSGSIGINYIKKFLDDNSIVFNEEVTCQNMVYKDKLKIDICFDSINLEYDGDQHFKRGRGRNEDERKERKYSYNNVEIQLKMIIV